MSRETSPYPRGDYWLDKRRDGKSPHIWQIARSERGTVIYRSTGKRELADAIAVMDARIEEERSKQKGQLPTEALAAAHIVNYWKEKGRKLVNNDQTGRSLRTFLAFLMQDEAGVEAVIIDLTPALFERFREWRMGPHAFSLTWFDETYDYTSKAGVSGATVQRNINDIRAAVNFAVDNARIPMAPRINDLAEEYQSDPRDRVLTWDELGKIAWYAKHNPALFRFFALQLGTAVRPQAALKFDPAKQFLNGRLIDLQPEKSKRTKKRNAIIPAIRPLRTVLRAWARDGADPVASRKTVWRIMRRALNLSGDVHPKTIRHTVATLLYADPTVPEREIVEMLAHEGKLARTTRIYAKYNPDHLVNVTRALTTIWQRVSREARRFGSDHILTTIKQGGEIVVVEKGVKC